MSDFYNTDLIQHAIDVAQEIEDRLEDDSYMNRVAVLANAEHVDMDAVDMLLHQMKIYLLPEATIW